MIYLPPASLLTQEVKVRAEASTVAPAAKPAAAPAPAQQQPPAPAPGVVRGKPLQLSKEERHQLARRAGDTEFPKDPTAAALVVKEYLRQPLTADERTRLDSLRVARRALSLAPLPGARVAANTISPSATVSTDAQFLDVVGREVFRYFIDEADPSTGLIKDRSTPDSPSSIAADGFGLSALAVGVPRGWVSRDEAYARSLKMAKALDHLQRNTPQYHGFFHHFLDEKSLENWKGSEVSSIDTALLMAGLLHSAEAFPNTELSKLANQMYDRVDWTWMLNGGKTLSYGYADGKGFIPQRWEGHSEGLLLYILALGSKTHPIPAGSWQQMASTYETRSPAGLEPYVATPTDSLFTYEYPQVWLDLKNVRDEKGINYFENSRRAVEADAAFSEAEGSAVFGVTASDGPGGYRSYGANAKEYDGTIAPTGAGGAMPFDPALSIHALRTMTTEPYAKLWGDYGPKDAFNLKKQWFDGDYLGIDQGTMLLMIANTEDEGVWRASMRHPAIQRGLERAGFTRAQAEPSTDPH